MELIENPDDGQEKPIEQYVYLMDLTVELIQKRAWLDGKPNQPYELIWELRDQV